jgi:hypothetical protein
MLAVNAVALWKAVIFANYVYGEAFLWGKALGYYNMMVKP